MMVNTPKPRDRTTSKKEGPLFIADFDQLQTQLKLVTKRRLIVGGQLMMASLEPLRAQAGYLIQAPRATKGGFMPSAKGEKTLNLLLAKDALDLLVQGKQKPIFAVDSLLKYGFRLKGIDEHCVIGALEGTANTPVLVLTFKKQKLVAYSEFQLAHVSQNTYEADLHLLLNRLAQDYSGATFHWCGPVAKPKLHRFVEPDVSLWAAGAPQTLTVSGQPSVLRKHGLAVAILGLTAVGYAGALYEPYQKYAKAKQELLMESQALKGDQTFNAERLGVLRSRQAIFENQKRSEARLSKFLDVIAAFAQEPNLVVKSATLLSGKPPAPGARPGKRSEFEITVEIPAPNLEMPVLDQGSRLLVSLAARTGSDLRLATGTDSYRESGSKDAAFRTYKIQGDFKNGN